LKLTLPGFERLHRPFTPLTGSSARLFSAYPDSMHAQQQSPLSRIPRELRDEIYSYYVHHEGGLHYQFAGERSDQRHSSDGQPVELPLRSTCSRLALETKGVVFHSNTVHVYPGDKNSTHRAIPSDALRFKRLLEHVSITVWRMLLLCCSCTTPCRRSQTSSTKLRERI
jgi:hypothetical protein